MKTRPSKFNPKLLLIFNENRELISNLKNIDEEKLKFVEETDDDYKQYECLDKYNYFRSKNIYVKNNYIFDADLKLIRATSDFFYFIDLETEKQYRMEVNNLVTLLLSPEAIFCPGAIWKGTWGFAAWGSCVTIFFINQSEKERILKYDKKKNL